MKKLIAFIFVFTIALSSSLSAQLRSDLTPYYEYSGPIINSKAPTVQSWLNDFFQNKVTMSHSYSMNFSSYGGNYQNLNAYTNTLNFMFTPNLTGRLDVSFLHSPFGGNNFASSENNLGGEIIIRNAELNYKLGDNARIQLQYRQIPAGYGMYNPYGYASPFGYGYNRFNNPW